MSAPYYEDDLVTLYHGDCIEIMGALPDGSVDTVLTDPPYSSGGRRENSKSLRKSMTRSVEDDDWIRGDAMSTNGFTYLLRMCGVQWRRVLRPGGHDGDHPTEKPTALLQTLLSVVTPADGIVLDPFAGSASTLTAAKALNLRAIGIEADERYCEIAAKRLSQDTLFGGVA